MLMERGATFGNGERSGKDKFEFIQGESDD
jgi:hypothetical protein